MRIDMQKFFDRLEVLTHKMDRLAAEKGRPGSTNVDDLPAAEAAEWRRLVAYLPEQEDDHGPQTLSCFI